MKKICLLVSILILAFHFSIPVNATENGVGNINGQTEMEQKENEEKTEEKIEVTLQDRIVDSANLLSDSEKNLLLKKIDEIANIYEFDVVIVTSDDYEAYDAVAEADDFFDYNGYGFGENNDGIIYYVNLETRDWAISTTGYGLVAFTDYGTDTIGAICQTHLTEQEYYEAFVTYIELTGDYLEEAKNGQAYDINNQYVSVRDRLKRVLVVSVVSLIIAAITIGIMKSKMKTAVSQPYAKAYVKDGSFKLTRERDSFLYSHTSKTAIPKSNSSSGGTSSHSGSSGSSHGGSHGSF